MNIHGTTTLIGIFILKLRPPRCARWLFSHGGHNNSVSSINTVLFRSYLRGPSFLSNQENVVILTTKNEALAHEQVRAMRCGLKLGSAKCIKQN